MTTYSVRCKVAACRHRRVIDRHPDEYKRPPKCPMCGSKNGWRIENRDYNKRNLCHCSSVVFPDGRSAPHQTTHPLCDRHPQGFYNQAKLRGVADEDIPLEHLGKPMKEDEPCPF